VQHPIEAGVAALAVAISLCICLAYVLLVQLLDWWTGIVLEDVQVTRP